MRRILTAASLLVVLVSSAVSEVQAVNKGWTNPGGGFFSDPGNWSPPGAPGPADSAAFIFPPSFPSFTVTFTGGVTNDSLLIGPGNVNFALGGNTYQLTNPVDGAPQGAPANVVSVIVGAFPGNGGSLTVTNGTLQGVHGHIANVAGSTGAATVSGAGASWINNGILSVGTGGTGTLTVEAGGYVFSGAPAMIGRLAGSQGTATVTGLGSLWMNTANLIVGADGNGILTIADGAAVSSSSGNVAIAATSQGTVTVTGSGSTWTNSGDLLVGMRGSADVTIENGGSIANASGYISGYAGDPGGAVVSVTVTGEDSTWTNTGELNVGYANTGGELTIADGGGVSNTYGFVGVGVGAEGAALVTGASATWTNSLDLFVGFFGTGNLTIEDGGSVSNVEGFIGHSSGAQGNVTVDGTGSEWSNSGDLFVGFVGSGDLVVQNGGSVTAEGIELGYSDSSSSNGVITVTGDGSNLTAGGFIRVGSGVGNTGELNIESGGSVSSEGAVIGDSEEAHGTVTVAGDGSMLTVGDSFVFTVAHRPNSTGELTIADGGHVASAVATIGLDIGANGTAIVTGVGSTWDCSIHLTVGQFMATGEMTIESGGQVFTKAATLGAYSSSNGTVTVSGNGSMWTNDESLYIAHTGNGTLTITNGGSVSSENSYIGREIGSQGAVTVNGAGSSWNHSADLFVGYRGEGDLTIEDGGAVTNRSGYIGWETGSQGAVTVTGAGSTWVQSMALGEDLSVGYRGEGELTIEDGGAVSTDRIYIGFEAGSQGTATVTGNGATSNSFGFSVGFRGSGELTIADGGTVTAEQSFIGFFDDAEGTATITGVGSNWTTTGSGSFSFLSVGYEATGELLIENGGSADSEVGYIGHFDGAQGSTTITGAGSVWTTTVNLTLGGNSMGPTTAVGTLTLNDGGKVDVGGTLQLYANGTLTGSGGIVVGNVNNAGEVAPGSSSGVLTIEGDYEQTANGKLTMQLAGTDPGTEYDQLIIQGSATLDGLLEVVLIDDFMPSAGDSFDILNWLGFTGSFDVDLPPIDADLVWNTNLLYTDGILQVDLAAQPGDHNGDDAVDAADYVVWRKTDSGNSQGYIDWQENFGEGTGAGGAPAGASHPQTGVPEPATLVLLMIAAAGGCLRRGRAA